MEEDCREEARAEQAPVTEERAEGAPANAEPAEEVRAEASPEANATAYEERDATLDEDPIPAMTADELQESILEDSGMNAFQKFCARMDDRKWALMQRVVGALLGVIAGVALFWDTLVRPAAQEAQQGGLFSIPLIVAIVVALIVPNIIEKQSQRRAPQLRVAMVIALAIVLAVYFIAIGMQTGFHFTA